MRSVSQLDHQGIPISESVSPYFFTASSESSLFLCVGFIPISSHLLALCIFLCLCGPLPFVPICLSCML